MCTRSAQLDSRYDGLWASESCEEDKVCVPESMRPVQMPGLCRAATSGEEGRCLPECLGSVVERASWLEQDGCGEHERCLPCVDPNSGEDTGACHLAGDPGPSGPTALAALRCDETGHCSAVPTVIDQAPVGPPEPASCDEPVPAGAPASDPAALDNLHAATLPRPVTPSAS